MVGRREVVAALGRAREVDRRFAVGRRDLGDVLVVNFWYASCAPCRAEAPDLEKIHAEFDGQGATFVGVNVRDQAATAASF
ncbi:TlpA disulfide reductase family protein, partial [Rhizobium johnstonii]|uniref:TlpA disulfide reductase family protein n=1 Tax=Rhizobium johnstonii TaxID=3019933 RepID=UPI003F994F65